MSGEYTVPRAPGESNHRTGAGRLTAGVPGPRGQASLDRACHPRSSRWPAAASRRWRGSFFAACARAVAQRCRIPLEQTPFGWNHLRGVIRSSRQQARAFAVSACERLTAGEGAKGPRLYDRAYRPGRGAAEGWETGEQVDNVAEAESAICSLGAATILFTCTSFDRAVRSLISNTAQSSARPPSTTISAPSM